LSKGPEDLPAGRRQRIVDAALEEFAERGYARASTNVITEKAGISKGLLFHYFGSKKNLYLWLVEYAVDHYVDWRKRNRPTAEPSPDLIERMMQNGVWKLEFIRSHPVISKFLTGAFTDTPEDVGREIKTLSRRYQTLAVESFSEGINATLFRDEVDPRKAVEVLVIFLQGLKEVYAERVSRNRDAVDTMFEEVREYFEILKYGIYRKKSGK